MNDPVNKAVFLSYASQDKEAAAKICDALRAAGVEVWFDQSELRGGDAWDAMIRKRIKDCALFVPLITPTTNARAEGYFRLEWKLAVDRSHLMADDAPFLFPIVIGDVTDATARVPDKFRDVQWTRLRLDETPAELGARVAKLLAGSGPEDRRQGSEDGPGRTARGRQPGWLRYGWAAVGIVFALVYAVRPLLQPVRRTETKPATAATVAPKAPAPVSAARQLAEKARVLFDKIDSNADDYAVAESLLKRALELDATDGVIWAYSARLNAAYLTRSFERGTARAETARNHAERAVKLAPESAEAWHALGRAIWRSDLPRAEEALRHALQLAPDDGHILLSLGSICRNAGRDEDALAYYVRAAAQPEVRPLALYDQFLIHLYMRRFAEAERCGREAASLLPTTNSVSGVAILEIVWHGQVAAAQRTLDAAPSALRAEPRMVFAAALAALMAKQADGALSALDRMPGDYINDAWYSGPKALFVGLAHLQAGRSEAARTAWETGLAVVRRRLQDAPNDAELHLRLGEMLAWTGQTEAASREARVFEELARGRTDWTYSSARIYAALGRADEAVPILEKFLAATGTGRWPLTPALLRLDPLWDKIRGDPRFQKLCEEPATPGAAPVAKVDDKSVAVLAFANLSDDKANEYFSDGISEELLNVLAKVPGLKVTARTSSFHFKGTNTAIPEIAQQLGVAYVIEGSVRKAGDRVRITAQLIKADGGFHVWSDTFTRDLKDIFAVQDEIAGLIAQNLQLKMNGAAKPAVVVAPEAYRLYLEGRQILQRRTEESYAQAEKFFEQAKASAPDWAPIYAGLADVARLRAFGTEKGPKGPDSPWTPEMKEAVTLANRALELDPALAEAYVSLAGTNMLGWNFPETERLIQRAVELNPNLADAYLVQGRVLSAEGRLDESIAAMRRAADLNPLSARILDNLAAELEYTGRYEESWAIIERASALQPDSSQIQCYRVRLLANLGRRDEALALARRMVENLNPEEREFRLLEVAHVYAFFGMKAESAAIAAQIPADVPEHVILQAYLGEPQKAVPRLDQLTFGWIEDLMWGRGFDPIRSDAGYKAYLARTGLTEADARARAWRAAHPWPKSAVP